MKNNTPSRNCGLDIIRCFALFCVIGIHFFLEIKFDEMIIAGKYGYVILLVRSPFLVCVPLFMMLSGYLMKNRTPSRKYYSKLIKTMSVYVMASLCCAAFYVAYYYFFEHRLVNIADKLWGILAYNTAPYGWYMEMYVGLFLLIPYLNILYNNIGSQQGKKNLILTLMILSVLPSTVNIFALREGLGWFLHPTTSTNYMKLVPVWWERLYPLVYYFFGCYLSEYPLKLTRKQNLLLILVNIFVMGTHSFYRNANVGYLNGPWEAYTSPFVVTLTVLVFEFFVRGDYSFIGEKGVRFLTKLSGLSLPAYLVSWIFDSVVYHVLFQIFPGLYYKLLLLPIAVPIIFVCSLLLAACIDWVYECISKCITSCRKAAA